MAGGAVIVAGFGFRQGAAHSAFEEALARATAGGWAVDALATVEGKAAELARFAQARGLPLIAVSPQALQAPQTATQSAASKAAHGVGSVAEAAALAAAGPGALLLAPRLISSDKTATCALAQSAQGETQWQTHEKTQQPTGERGEQR